MMPLTIRDALLKSAQLNNISETPRLDAECFLAKASGFDRTYFFTWPERKLTPHAADSFMAMLARRKQGEPVAHITGQREFWSLPLKVNASTLIPRPDTEVLVETALEALSKNTPCHLLDLGTGTGAIALALASERPLSNIIAIDANADAIALAKENAKQCKLQNIYFQHASWLDTQWWQALKPRSFDMIVSNPPYIDKADPHLSQGDVRFEPASALIAGNKGLADITAIIQASRGVLKNQGFLWLEHGCSQAEPVQAILAASGYSNIQTRQDYGGNPRVTGGQYEQGLQEPTLYESMRHE